MTKGKKEQAFAIFDQGRRPSDPEVKALGAKNKTLYMYFTLSGSSNPSRTEVDEPNNPTRTGTGNSKSCSPTPVLGTSQNSN